MYCVILITTKNIQEAKKIINKLLHEKLIACGNIIDDVKSRFWWNGEIDNANEVLLVLKTKKSLFNKIVKSVKSVHSYEVPEIIALPIINGYNPYLKWINESTQKGKVK